jgi:EmrB/QacA subfamily drug resistance transporter
MPIRIDPSAAPRSPLLKPGARAGVATATAAAAQLMIILDERVVNIALPSMRADLRMAPAAMQWVITGYLVTFGGFLLLAARANDLFGRRRVFVTGLVVFTLASLAGGLAASGLMLVVARLLQGVGAAILAPASLILVTAINVDPGARRRAMAVWATVTSTGAAAGVVLGGVLTDALGWRSVMFINLPIGLALVAAAVVTLASPARRPGTAPRLDIAGAASVTIGIGALVYGISEAPRRGWLSVPVAAALAAAVALLACFLVVERRSAAPLVDLGLFRIRHLRNANVALLSFGAVLTASLYYLSLYLQRLAGYSPLRAGLALVPMSVLLGVGSMLSGRLIRAGVRGLPGYGAALAAAGLVWLAFVPASGSFVTAVLCPTLVVGAGFSVILVPLAGAATAGVDPGQLGTASGLLNVSRQIGGAVGLAVVVTITTAVTGGRTTVGAELAGYHTGFLLAAALSVTTAVAGWKLARAGS